jgi:hypothetical protein
MGSVFAFMQLAGGAFFATAWVASVAWTVRDAGRRCDDPSFRLASAAGAVLVPFVGAGVYALGRPCEERFDVKARRLRVRLLESALELATERCSGCSGPVEAEFRCCPSCGEQLRVQCGACGAMVRPSWAACPWCAEALVEKPRLETRHSEAA